MISIICPVNNYNVLKMLTESLEKQTIKDYELIIIDATKMKFKSAAETLNYGVSISKGDILLFVHQDVELINNDALAKIIDFSKNNDFGIAGVAGKNVHDKYCTTSVLVGKNRRPGGQIKTTDIIETQTLDECLFIIKKDKFNNFTNYGNTWHFYSVDYCLKMLESNEKVLLFPIDIYHLSPGYSMNYNYYTTLKKVGKNHKKIKIIATTCGTFKNDSFLALRCLYLKCKLFLKKVLKKGIYKE